MTKIAKIRAVIGGAVMTLGATTAMAQTDVTVAVPNPSAILWGPIWAAAGEGYFEEEGLSVDVQAVDGSSAVLQAMSAGQAQIGVPGPGPVLAARARDLDAVFIYNMYPKSLFGLLVESSTGITDPAELEGQTVGVGTADGAEVAFARAILGDAGLTEGEGYEFLPVGDGGTAAVAFLRDEVDSYAGAISDAAILRSRGIELTEITPEKFLGFFGNGVATTRGYMEENPDVIEGFGRALVRGMEFMSDPANSETTLDHMAAGNPQEGEDREFAGALLDAVVERMTPTDAYADQGFGYQPPEHWEAWHQSLQDNGVLDAPLDDLSAAFTNDFVATWNGQ
ncbi:ABC transporter substrate-binding protein [Palleronia pelagia]|uniref:NitT/TauT family transport system substrate-binding protein n=1 Tax=Palleronia pelagia TaxID=387096 RepID=A0A1H8AHP8_9RHOB|nr:ABC transporter substrate-binding protein [Palleronia pelagia]SEM70141.1 NitT/TauT family transport system substrate-binding protein [Palleronia pelagia]